MKRIALASGLALALSAPALQADPAFGLGVSYVFGGGTSDVAIGARAFSDDTPHEGVVSLGLDYKLGSQSLRPNIGAAYLDDDVYGDVSLGYDFGTKGVDFGVGLGGWGN
ncbi:hypothetical protein FLO80_04335 [Aquicoccus porphyridii]|uniref:Porin family protein n=1 Tax=Aquicoccus porphyridii TaxID=1852029 RepID=A0A5A9ZUE0_9RHOB|nr:hypothetical protein [Aquicoccus porphyridii]KAA0920345.1 hypothetical protein FLO80_04335 [Aquicoccus porphyridii]RAI54862.1 hypothetical protein DOO74_06445 [Rhodobacteraceae bacterium AsT-22]